MTKNMQFLPKRIDYKEIISTFKESKFEDAGKGQRREPKDAAEREPEKKQV